MPILAIVFTEGGGEGSNHSINKAKQTGIYICMCVHRLKVLV